MGKFSATGVADKDGKGKDKIIAEYALGDMTKPIGVSEYKLFEELSEDLRRIVPETEDLERLEHL